MKNKKIFMFLIIIILLLIISGLGYLVYININSENNENNIISEYTPEAEITDEQLRETIITLYFLDNKENKLAPEARQVDVKNMLENPYSFLIQLLIEGPKNEKFAKLIPDNTKINKAELKDGILYIDFSKEFIENQKLGEEKELLIINSIVNTLTELNEVNKIKFLIDGEENRGFADGEVDFKNTFERI